MADLDCDVAIIGAGTAGMTAERRARQAGAKTLLIDPNFAGTTCATVGCMPSKLLIAAARAAHHARGADLFGVRAGPVKVDGKAVLTRVRSERDRFAAGARKGFDRMPEGSCVTARARFTGPTELVLDDGRTVSARAVVIATGSGPSVPPPYRALGDALLTNETVFELEDLPGSLAVIGAGVIGLELAQAMARLDVRVAVFDMADRMAQIRSDDVHEAMCKALSEELELHLGVDATPELTTEGVTIHWEGGEDTFDRVLVATGRPPRLKGLDLEAAGLELDDRGMPQIDPGTLQCGDAPIFIAGDANAQRPVLHEAAAEGALAGGNAATWPRLERAERHIPFTIVFTDPPLVSFGAGPDAADQIGTTSFASQSRARIEGLNRGVVQLYGAAPDGRLIGGDLFCPGADHLGHQLAWAAEGGRTACELLDLPYYHPTLEEGLRSALSPICRRFNGKRG